MFIIAVASFVGWVLARERVPQMISGHLLSLSDNPLVVLLIIHALLLLFGCFLEATAILIILMPTLLPVITALKIDPVFFGVTVIINLAIGTVTPPVGTCLFVTSAISQLPMDKVVAEAWPFLVVMVAILLLILVAPQTVLWLPSLVF
jgi:C4-dicarboxylate transporter, DctM subunit